MFDVDLARTAAPLSSREWTDWDRMNRINRIGSSRDCLSLVNSDLVLAVVGAKPDGFVLEVVLRAEMFAHHHIQRERLSVGERMTEVLALLGGGAQFVPFQQLFRPAEGRMGVTITFAAILELMREGLIDIVQAQAYAPLHVRAANPGRMLRVVTDNTEAASPADEDLS